MCTWNHGYRLELVANDIRVNGLDLDVELAPVPWYARIPKDISAMYACCSYGKQYEELLETTEHLGRKWNAMVKFCDTRFAQSELKVYIHFEKNFNTYCRTWVPERKTRNQARRRGRRGRSISKRRGRRRTIGRMSR